MSGRVVGIATLNLEGGKNLNFAISAQQIASVWLAHASGNAVITDNPIKQNTPAISKSDITGNWVSLKSNNLYQIIDNSNKVSIIWIINGEYVLREFSDFDAKWVGDSIIGYHNSSYYWGQHYFIIKIIDDDRIGVWRIGTLKPTDSDDKILRELTKKARKKPQDVWKRSS